MENGAKKNKSTELLTGTSHGILDTKWIHSSIVILHWGDKLQQIGAIILGSC